MSEMTITEFCDKHAACTDGRNWALSTGLTTMADLWQREDMLPEWREWVATRDGVLTDRELRLYACWCVRQVWHLLPDERSRNAVEVAERHANGMATDAELDAAWAAARAAWAPAWAAERAAERAATWAAERAAERAATGAPAWAAARAAWAPAWAAERAATGAATGAAAWAPARAALAAQSRYLLANTRPNFANKEGGR